MIVAKRQQSVHVALMVDCFNRELLKKYPKTGDHQMANTESTGVCHIGNIVESEYLEVPNIRSARGMVYAFPIFFMFPVLRACLGRNGGQEALGGRRI